MAIHSTQEFMLEVDTESALGTASTSNAKTWQVDDTPTMLGRTRQVASANVRGFEHPANDNQNIPYEGYFESALTVPFRIRQSNAGDGVTQLTRTAESCGCNVDNFINTTVDDVAAAVDEIDLTADVCEEGQVAGIYTVVAGTDSGYLPMLIAKNNASTVNPLFDLPNAPANTAAVYNCTTITPRIRQVPVAKTLNMTFAQNNYGESDALTEVYSGCACSSLGSITFEPNADIKLSPTFHVARNVRTPDDTELSEAFVDGENSALFGDNYTFVYVGNYAATGGITPVSIDIMSAEFTFGVTTLPIIGTGGNSLNGIQGYMSSFNRDECRLVIKAPIAYGSTIEALLNDLEVDDPENEINWKSFGLFKTSADENNPCVALYLPRCKPVEFEVDRLSESYRIATLTYQPVNAGLNSISDVTDSGDQPWYLSFLNPKAA